MSRRILWTWAISLFVSAATPSWIGAASSSVVPLIQAHAHNDYEHTRPLLDALDHGFCSVEADIHRVGAALVVGHDPEDLREDRTLEALYLEPLRQRIRENGGSVYPSKAEFILLIDIKTDAEKTYQRLRKDLFKYRRMLTRFSDSQIVTGAVTVILSGNRPIQTVRNEKIRWCGIDGRLPDLEKEIPVSLMPLISASWVTTFTWRGEGSMPEEEQVRLRHYIATAHQERKRIRFWATGEGDRPWTFLRSAGVDLINSDDLAGLSRFLRR